MKEFGVRGRAVGELVTAQTKWQIEHPNGNAAELVEALRPLATSLSAKHST